jgi:hypothetical protein
MTLAQMRLFVTEGERLERERRAAFIADVHCAASGVMGEGDHVQRRIDELLGG